MSALWAAAPEELGNGDASAEEDRRGKVPVTVHIPSRIQSRSEGPLQTAGDAYRVCKAMFEEQQHRALDTGAAANTAAPGDSSARAAFLLLLTDSQQRALFLETATRPEMWPRIRTLFGAPPFHFLRASDAAALNASGFAKGRANMTYESGSRVANMQQFGPGQLMDQHLREYRVSPLDVDPADPLPGAEYFQRATRSIILQVKIKKTDRQHKRQLLHTELKKQLFFPQPGDRIVLRETARMLSARGLKNSDSTELQVKALWPRSEGSSTAAVLVSL